MEQEQAQVPDEAPEPEASLEDLEPEEGESVKGGPLPDFDSSVGHSFHH